ncbi:porin [Crenobacter cavernae]|uniref:Porin n=1 Tax=Crenobacter cavernae TaxID=2290923 RepID=A0ABY0FH09_9NEIS|nr:porin [Crenobacter cavernae]RXZ44533.1 porin [Crenobacter cavernae]
MNKLIPLALAALPAAAMADVTIYGKVGVGLEYNKNTFSDGSSLGATRVDDYVSWLGFKGAEDLGSGSKAIWQIESAVWMDGSGSNTFGTRDTFVGLSGNLGMVRLGRLSNAQRYPMKPAVDLWFSSTPTRGGANEPNIFTRTAYFAKNSVRYDSPDLNGLKGSLQWSAGENGAAGKRVNDAWNAGLSYRLGPWFLDYGHDRQANPAGLAEARHADADTVALGYAADGLRTVLAYQQARGWDWNDRGFIGPSGAATDIETREYLLSLAYDVGRFTPMFTYAYGADQKANGGRADDSGYRQWIAGVNYRLSKRTSLILSHGRLSLGQGVANYNPYKDAPAGASVRKESTTALELRHFF